MPAQLHLSDSRIKRWYRFALVESSDIVLLLPSLMAYAKRKDTRQRDAVQDVLDEAKLE